MSIRAARTEREASAGGNTDQVNSEFSWDEECFIEFDRRMRDRDRPVLTSMTPGTSENLTAKERRVVAEHNNIDDQETIEEKPEVITIIKSTEEKRQDRKRLRNQRLHKEQRENFSRNSLSRHPSID